MAGTTVAQVSEFSFILLAAGIKLGQIEPSILTLATLVGLITITVSSYLITFNDVIYDFFSPLFRWFEPKGKASLGKRRGIKTPEVVLLDGTAWA